MPILFLYLFINFIGNTEARRIDTDRVRFLEPETKYKNHRPNRSRSLPEAFNIKINDYENNNGRFRYPRMPLKFHQTYSQSLKPPLKVYEPREDPRLFYQTDAYRRQIMGRSANHYEVTFAYPGNEVVRLSEKIYNIRKPSNKRLRDLRQEINITKDNICIRCPNDRTLIASTGYDSVLLQPPHVYTCSGLKAPRDIRFIPIYGPKFGSFIPKGSHVIFGRISYNGQSYHLCKMQVHVITQTCATPPYLVSHCGIRDKPCNFTCRDPHAEIFGKTSLLCGSDMKWKGNLPVCKAQNWCKTPLPPPYGRVSCTGAMVPNGSGFIEDSKCRVRCARGYRWQRAVAVCRRGSWSANLKCILKSRVQL